MTVMNAESSHDLFFITQRPVRYINRQVRQIL